MWDDSFNCNRGLHGPEDYHIENTRGAEAGRQEGSCKKPHHAWKDSDAKEPRECPL